MEEHQMSEMVRFGMNLFQRPAGSSSTKGWNTAEWLKQTRARRAGQLRDEHTVNGQEVTPQHQRQQLLAQVERAHRPQLLALFNQVIMRHVRLENAFNASELASGAKDISKLRGPNLSEREMRERLVNAINSLQPAELSALYLKTSATQRIQPVQIPIAQHDDTGPSL
jgi:hypothetical protein